MTSVLNVDTIADKAGTGPVGLTKQYALKMWVNFNQGGPTARDSFNLSSLTDVAVGKTNIVMTSAMSDGNYAGSYFNNASGGSDQYNFGNNYAGAFGNGVATGGRTSTTIVTASYAAAYVDSGQVDATAVGDLA